MGETFYSVLGVATDADRERIRRAYRDRVKETHPDVSDNPDASEAFKRVTTARDVLLDETERTRYDRLGHNTYVRRHVDNSAWNAPQNPNETTSESSESATAAWNQGQSTTTNSWRSSAGARETRNQQATAEQTTANQSRTDGGYATESWQTASAAYRRTRGHYDVDDSFSLRDLFELFRKAGSWLVVYVVFVISAATTAWFSYTATAAGATTMVVFATLVLLFVVLFSVLYLFVELHP